MAFKPKIMELTVLSAEGLHLMGKPADKNVFAVVRAESITSHTTAMASASHGIHTWNENFAVELGPHARCVTIEVKCKTETGVLRDVGLARIAVSDLLAGASSETEHCSQCLCYRLRDWDGRENGNVNFSVRVAPPTHQ